MTDEHTSTDQRATDPERVAGTDADRPPATGADGATPTDDGRVSAGVLAADARTREEIDRRRRWLVGGAVLGVVVLLAFLLGSTLAREGAQQEAREAAEVDRAASAFATDVVDQAEAYERAALRLRVTADALRVALEEHLTVTDRVEDELARTVELTTETLATVADEVAALTERTLPTADALVDPDARDAVLTELEQLRVEARALVEEVRATVPTARAWSSAVVDLDEALAAHAAIVDDKSDSTDPAVLAEGWRAELEPLATLEERAAAAADQPGLSAWAEAHGDYARATTAFVEEALPLLEDGQLEQYNTLFLDTFGGDDPFGFQAAARAGATEALTAPPIADLAAIEERGQVVLDALETVERTVADRLAEGA